MKPTLKVKLVMFLTIFAFLFFFSNDFGLIDVEKTSIITAIAIDKSGDEFQVTAQIAVPEATDANTENLKAQLSGKGTTVGSAIKDLGDISGWFPKLAFCNLILLGNSLSQTNVIEALDYFAKTLRVQDSALVAISEKSAKELLDISTPLDNISAFALQKIMLKTQGFDQDVASTDIKSFCSGHYSRNKSAYMPIVKIISAGNTTGSEQGGSSSQGQSGSSSQGNSQGGQSASKLFDARSTALFKNGYMVGQLDENLTLMFKAFSGKFNGTTLPVDNVLDSQGRTSNYLLYIIRCTPSIKTSITDKINLDLSLNLYCKISDHDVDGSSEGMSQNTPLPKEVKTHTENLLKNYLLEMVETSKQTGCDFLGIREKIYRFHNKDFNKFGDNYLDFLSTNISVTVEGQKL